MPFRNAKHARSSLKRCPIESRGGIFRNSIHAKRQNNCLTYVTRFIKSRLILLYLPQQPRQTFQQKKQDNTLFQELLYQERYKCSSKYNS